jgi:acyl-CoA dehydrogenase
MCAIAAPAVAASIAASAISSGVTGTRSLRSTVAPAPLTAQVMKTSQFSCSPSSPENAVRPVARSLTRAESREYGARHADRVRSMNTRGHIRDPEKLVTIARRFAREELRPVALQYDESEEFPATLVRKAAELGLTCYDLPAEYGGGGIASLRHACRVIEEIAWGDSPISWAIAQGGFFAHPLLELGTEEQKERWLRPVCDLDPPVCAVAITEPGAGSDAAAIATEAKPVEGGYVISGHKKFIGNAPLADVCIVFATVAPGTRSRGITAFVVERDDPGFVIGDRLYKMGSRCFPAGELHFDECFVEEDRRLGQEGQGFRGLMRVFDRARVQLAASSLGIGRAALEHAVDHAREREAFGAKIHEYQAVSFRLVDAKLKLDQARLVTYHAAERADAGHPFSTEAAMAKLAASEASWFTTWAAAQTLAGAGYIRTSLVQKWLRDAKLDEIWDGTSDIMRLIIARSLFGSRRER